MRRAEIRTRVTPVTCDVCGRTMLRGESAEDFLQGGVERRVCELCVTRARQEGWVRASDRDAPPLARPLEVGRRSVLGRLRPRREELSAGPARSSERAEEKPASRGLRSAGLSLSGSRGVHAVPTNGQMKLARAVELFNGSQHPRKVAGIARSLGVPSVAVSLDETRESVVSIVVVWELSWYRFETDLADESRSVRVADQGYEISQLGEGEPQANAYADERGALALTS